MTGHVEPGDYGVLLESVKREIAGSRVPIENDHHHPDLIGGSRLGPGPISSIGAGFCA
jgi:hypothetical protein